MDRDKTRCALIGAQVSCSHDASRGAWVGASQHEHDLRGDPSDMIEDVALDLMRTQ